MNRRTAKLLALHAVAFVVLGLALGGRGVVVASVVALLMVAWRRDGGMGPFFIFGLLFLIVIGVCALLLTLIAVTH